MRRVALLYILVWDMWFISAPSWAAERKVWVRLADCQYVEQAYNDGDSIYVHCGAQEFIVRLYFVDAPESNLRYPDRTREQSEYFGVTLDETLRAGRHAAQLVRERLQTPFVIWTRWASAAGRTTTPRYYGVVEVEGQNLAELLVREGLARTKGVMATGPRASPHASCKKNCKYWNAQPGNTSAACGRPPLLALPHRPLHKAVAARRRIGISNALCKGAG